MSLDVVCFLSAEIVLVVAALAIYLGGAFSASQKVWAPLALGAIVLAAVSLWSCGGNERYIEHRAAADIQHAHGAMITSSEVARQISVNTTPVTPDPLSTFGRWFALGVGAVMVLMAWRPLPWAARPSTSARSC